MNQDKITVIKGLLEKELALLVSELSSVGRINPENSQDWQATPPEVDALGSEREEVAENFEGYEENTAILKQLEIKLHEVKHALKKIEDGTYGVCEVCSAPIEADRLEANTSATTCKEHTKK